MITVGASENVRPIGATDGCGVTDAGANSARDIIDFSSRGPTDDGRIKPDIVAPGTHVTGAQPQTGADFNGSGTCNPQFPAGSALYTLVSGTSQAAPEVDRLRRAAARVVPGRDRRRHELPEPGDDQGADGQHGDRPRRRRRRRRRRERRGARRRSRAGAASTSAASSTARRARSLDQSTVFGATGDRPDVLLQRRQRGEAAEVTLAWTDAVGPTTGNAFVNDLDLEVDGGRRDVQGQRALGRRARSPGGTADPRNNLENVFLPAGLSGDDQGAGHRDATSRATACPATPTRPTRTSRSLVSNAGAGSGHRRSAHGRHGRTVTHGRRRRRLRRAGRAVHASRRTLRNVGNADGDRRSRARSTGTASRSPPPHATWPNLARQRVGDQHARRSAPRSAPRTRAASPVVADDQRHLERGRRRRSRSRVPSAGPATHGDHPNRDRRPEGDPGRQPHRRRPRRWRPARPATASATSTSRSARSRTRSTAT